MKKIVHKLLLLAFFAGLSGMILTAQNAVQGIDGTRDRLTGPVIITDPGTLYFDDTYIASSSQQTVTIFNAGDANLVITQANFTGPFETYNSLPITIAPGAVHNMVIQFKPFQLGLIQGSVTYVSNDPITPNAVVTLIGTCINTPINGWEWIYTGFNYINMDIEFPEGQDQIGYIVGQNTTMYGQGIILKTLNGGDTWNQVSTAGIHGLMNCSFPTLQTGYAVGWDKTILKTTNGGATWTETVVSASIDYIQSVVFKDINNGVIVGRDTGGNVFAYATTNGGTTWTPGTGNIAAEDVTYAGGNTYYSAGYENVCKSTNGGLTWTTVYTQGALLTGIYFYDENYGISAGDMGQVITTHNGGTTWETDLIYDWLFHKPFIWDYDTAYVVGTPEYVYKTTDGGLTWPSDFDGNWMKAFYTITFTNNYTGFISASGGIICRKKPAAVPAPLISATPNPLVFDNTNVGSTSQKTLTIQNTGDAPLQVTNITSTSTVFTVSNTSFTVNPGSSQNITAYFHPTAAGLVSGNLQVANNSATSPYLVAVSGTGAATGPAPIIITNPGTLYFDDTYIASSSQQTVTIFNAGDANLVITQANFIGPFETYNSLPITIAPGATHDMVIHFKPFELGLIQGSVTYVSNDPLTPNAVVNLIGTCINTPINGWEWIYTGYNYILTDIEFPEGQDQIGYTGGQSVTYNGLGIILKTTNGGDTWTPLTQYGIAGIERMSFPTLTTGYAAGWTDQIMKTTNGGQTWQNINVVTNVFYYSSIEFKDASNGIIIAKMNSGDPKTLYTSNGGTSWTEGTGNAAFEDVTWAGGNTWYTAGYSNVCKSTDNGATWTTVYTQGGLLLGADFLTPDYGIATGDYGQVIATRDGGSTWEEDIIYDWLFHKPFVWDYDTAYVTGTPEYIYKTTDAGQTWVSDFDGNWMKAFYAITFTNNYTGFVCGGSNGIVLRKKPGGTANFQPPTNLQAVVNDNDVTVSWNAPAQGTVLGYNVYRDNVKINTTAVANTTYIDNNLQPGTYIYAVSAVYSGGESMKTPFVQIVISGVTGKIHGFVRDAITHLSISNAVITASNADYGTETITTPFGGSYSMLLAPGFYDLTCSATGYQTATVTGLQVIANKNKGYTFYLTPSKESFKTAILDSDGIENEINVYPNPAIETLNIDGADIQKVVMMNSRGQVVYQNDSPLNINSIDVKQLQSGIYILRIETSYGVKTGKIVVE